VPNRGESSDISRRTAAAKKRIIRKRGNTVTEEWRAATFRLTLTAHHVIAAFRRACIGSAQRIYGS
jgi:hypothetical protein